MIGIGKVQSVKENHFETARGPQTDLLLTLEPEAGSQYAEQLVVSYKSWDKAKALKPGQIVKFPVFLEIVPGGKKGHWIRKIALDVEPVNAA